MSDSGEGRWTVEAAIDEGVPAPVITAALYQRFESRDLGVFTGKMLSAMRSEFGGHAEQKATKRARGPSSPAGQLHRALGAAGHARPDPHVIVLFGATGDLAKRKLLPGLLPPVRAPGCCPTEFRDHRVRAAAVRGVG